ADMVEGVMAANHVDQAQAGATRGALWDAVGSFGSPGAEVPSAADVLYRSSAARVA
ncbi:MAG: hypothetical protein JWL70_647, partial [Acidimicrobiia bacterium]|nr:hypothetical protein [Acidimicrobiia bacterium]